MDHGWCAVMRYVTSLADYVGVQNTAAVDSFNAHVRRVLQAHVRRSQPADKLRYSSLLLCLPPLFGISCRMLEALFCRHIVTRSGGTGRLLNEMLRDDDDDDDDGDDDDDDDDTNDDDDDHDHHHHHHHHIDDGSVIS